MKFKKRTRPADFGAAQHDPLVDVHAHDHDHAHWADLEDDHAQKPFDLEPGPYAPVHPPLWQSPLR